MLVEDRELVRRCCRGDEEAWQEFYGRFRPLVENMAAAALKRSRGARDLVEEITADVFEALVEHDFRALRSFRWQCSLQTWLRVLVRTYMIRRIRRKRPRLEGRGFSEEGDEPPATVMAEERRREVLSALKALPDREREVLARFFLEDQGYKEISQRMGLPMGTVATIISRTRARLREILSARGVGDPVRPD